MVHFRPIGKIGQLVHRDTTTYTHILDKDQFLLMSLDISAPSHRIFHLLTFKPGPMRHFILLIVFLLNLSLLQAQQAPDFTVTDTEGQVHHLYADYLDQGKTVMVKIFFTTCPPCNSIAPLMEPFYQEWGAGEYDVEFFEMTDKNFDTNTLVEAYAEMYGETFPAISMQGGSLEAVQPYKAGMFGPWYGTPTFIVIAPDGTVQYGISGSGNQATINAVDAALSATGALKPGQVPPAPDFSLIDSEGQGHQLYNGYLNQGKSVLLEIFNTQCAPCMSIGPSLQELYEEWGEGEHDVIFFALSDDPNDNNALVNLFRQQLDITFPSISPTGGSLTAVTPYTNGMYGPQEDVPVFVVIGPNRQVNYGLSGATQEQTLENIDAALLATGAEKPEAGEVPVTVSGGVTLMEGTTGISNADVMIVNGAGEIILSTTSNSTGQFSLEILASEVQPDWELKVEKTGNAVNGLSAIDLVIIQKHLLFIEPLVSPWRKLAADANSSATISSLDIVTILKIILGQSSGFPGGKNWIVLPLDTQFSPPNQHPPTFQGSGIPVQDILDGLREPKFAAVKKGDVNGSALPN